jgi:hypothetical protein
MQERRNLMLRKSVVFLSVLCVAATGAFMIGCGGSSSTPAKCTGTFTVVGNWQGTLSGGGTSDPLFGTIDSSGNATFFDSAADMIVLPGITGACSFSETLTAYTSIASGGPGVNTVTATGNVTSDSAITASAVSNGQTTSFSFSSYVPEATLSVPSGTVIAPIDGQFTDLLTLTFSGTTTSMSFTGTSGGGCTINGTFTEETVSNVYDVTLAYSGGGTCTGTFTGSGFESSADLLSVNLGGPAGTYLYGMMTSTSSGFVFEVIPPGVDAARRVHVRANKVGFGSLFGFKHAAR